MECLIAERKQPSGIGGSIHDYYRINITEMFLACGHYLDRLYVQCTCHYKMATGHHDLEITPNLE